MNSTSLISVALIFLSSYIIVGCIVVVHSLFDPREREEVEDIYEIEGMLRVLWTTLVFIALWPKYVLIGKQK